MSSTPGNEFRVAAGFQPLAREIGLDAEAVFDHPDIIVWRKLPDRENCTLDAKRPDGSRIRLHVKRYPTGAGTPAADEVRGHQLLVQHQIPTAALVGWGGLADGRSFVIFEDLAGYTPADKLIDAGTSFDPLLNPTADLAAKLHEAGLHHRDLYLCHFMARVNDAGVHLRLIDTARVRPLPRFLTRRRWIVKDLAQFWYSTTKHPVMDMQRDVWLARYAQQRKIENVASLRRSILRKSAAIARHDRNLNLQQPNRHISIPV